jgi:hypothetical protein
LTRIEKKGRSDDKPKKKKFQGQETKPKKKKKKYRVDQNKKGGNEQTVCIWIKEGLLDRRAPQLLLQQGHELQLVQSQCPA